MVPPEPILRLGASSRTLQSLSADGAAFPPVLPSPASEVHGLPCLFPTPCHMHPGIGAEAVDPAFHAQEWLPPFQTLSTDGQLCCYSSSCASHRIEPQVILAEHM